MRQYTRDRLFESGEAASIRGRHFEFFERLAIEAAPEVAFPTQVAAIHRLEADHDNMRAALEWCLGTSGSSEEPLRFVCALWPFWNRRNHFGEGRQWVERALATGSGAPRSLRAHGLIAAADLSYFLGDYATAERYAEEVVALDELGLDEARWMTAFASFLLGVMEIDRGEIASEGPPRGKALAERSVAVARETGAPWVTALAVMAVGFAEFQLGRLDRARELMEESVALARPLGDHWLLATLLFNLGIVLVYRREFEQAMTAAREGVVLSRELSDKRNLTWCLTAVAAVAASHGQLRRAARLWGAVEGLSQSVGSPLAPSIRHSQDELLPTARETLGNEAFAAAWAEGRQMTPDAAAAYALSDDE